MVNNRHLFRSIIVVTAIIVLGVATPANASRDIPPPPPSSDGPASSTASYQPDQGEVGPQSQPGLVTCSAMAEPTHLAPIQFVT